MTDGVTRLGRAGWGVIAGAVLLGGCSVVVSPLTGGFVVLFSGLGAALYQQQREEDVQPPLGTVAVGAIALFETLGRGLGLAPIELAGVALVFGLLDIVASRLLQAVSDRTAP